MQSPGLDTWKPPEALSYIRSSNEAFAAGRLDAEHFQPKYQVLINTVQKHKGNYQLVHAGDLVIPPHLTLFKSREWLPVPTSA